MPGSKTRPPVWTTSGLTISIGDAGTVGARPDNALPSVGVSYLFGQDEVTAPAPTPASIVQTERFTLKFDMLFNFDRATLKLEGQQALDQLYSQLSSMDPKDGSVIVLGYTDRISSDTYNQKLPLARTNRRNLSDLQRYPCRQNFSARYG